VDEVVVDDEIGERLFVGKNESDTIMTTWHDDEPLDEALDFFANLTCPTAGFERSGNMSSQDGVDSEVVAESVRWNAYFLTSNCVVGTALFTF
jgi:hypothetical protein